MPAPVVLLFWLIWVAYFIRWDRKQTPKGASELWLPTIFLLIAASRPVTWWNTGVKETTLLDTIVNVSFFLGALTILKKKKQEELAPISSILLVFLAYVGSSLLWTEDANRFHAVKQFIKLI